MKQGLVRLLYNFGKRFMGWILHMIMCVLLCYPVSIHMLQLLSTGRPISSLDHGLHVTKIYQVTEFSPQSCFREFRESVSDARRKGDENAEKLLLGDTMKLLGEIVHNI